MRSLRRMCASRRLAKASEGRAAPRHRRQPAAHMRCTTATPTSSTSCCRSGRPNSASATLPRRCCAKFRRHDGEPANSGGAAGRTARRPSWCSPRGTALAGLGYCLAGTSAGFGMLVVALLVGGIGGEHAAPDGIGVGRARFRRPALDESARHLQFRRRHRKNDDTGAGGVVVGRAAVAADARDSRRGSDSWRRRRSYS